MHDTTSVHNPCSVFYPYSYTCAGTCICCNNQTMVVKFFYNDYRAQSECICYVEMQQYIDISPYRDTLGSDTVSIHIKLYRYIDVSQCIDIQTVHLYVQYFMIDALVIYCGCQYYSSATTYLVLIEGCKFRKKVLFICKIQLIHTLLYRIIYRCIVIQKQQYINTPKLCIVAPLI